MYSVRSVSYTHLATAGKYVKEKKQDIIIDAIAKSKYEKVIQLIAAGDGPEENALRKKSYKLTNLPIFNWYSKEELYEILGYSDLYIHPSDFESEPKMCIRDRVYTFQGKDDTIKT